MDRKIPNKPHPTPSPDQPHAAGRPDWSSLARAITGAHEAPVPHANRPVDAEAEGPTYDSCFDDLNLVLSESIQQPDPDPNLGTGGEGARQPEGRDAALDPFPARRSKAPRTSEIFRTVVAGGGDQPASTGPPPSIGVPDAPAGGDSVPDLGLLDPPAERGDSRDSDDRQSDGSIPWGQILLLSYSSALTLALTWMFWTGRVPKAAAPAPPADTAAVESTLRTAEPTPEAKAPPLPSGNVAAIGRTVRIGDVEVTPLAVEAVPLELIHTIDSTRRRREDRCLVLRLRLTNLSDDQAFPPLDRNLVRERDLRMFDPYIATSTGRNIRLFPLALDSEWSILGQSFPILRPGESAETFIAAEPGSADHLEDEMTWRVRLRLGIYRNDMLGVKFNRKDVRRPRTISRDDQE